MGKIFTQAGIEIARFSNAIFYSLKQTFSTSKKGLNSDSFQLKTNVEKCKKRHLLINI